MNSKELNNQANGTRLSRLLIDKGTKVLKAIFDLEYPPSTLAADLIAKKPTLRLLRCKVINGAQWMLLYPSFGVPDSKNFDISLLTVLLQHLCGLMPVTGLSAMPPASDTSIAANILRIKLYRSQIYANTTTQIDDVSFKDLWREISKALVALGIPQKEIDELKEATISPKEELVRLLEELKKGTLKEDKTHGMVKGDKEQDCVGTSEETATAQVVLPLPVAEKRRHINWTKTSIKHRLKFEELVKRMETDTKITRIGIYNVCCDPLLFGIGQGSDGTTVFIGLCDDGTEVAVKELLLDRCKELGANEKEILNCSYVRKEQHIVNYRFYTEKVDSRHAYVVLDLCEETLNDYVLSEEHTKDMLTRSGPNFMRQILYGLKALHCGEPTILHRDLKPTNIFINLEGELVLADFGISRKLRTGQATHRSEKRGAEGWIAVESFPTEGDINLTEEERKGRYKKQSDIQVAGITLFFILTKGKHPYGSGIYCTVNLLNGKPVNLDQLDDFVAKDLIKWMLQHNPEDRPDVLECLKHPYLLSVDQQFNFVTRVGNEKEIKTKDASSRVVKQLNADPSLSTSSWTSKIDTDVMSHLQSKKASRYTDDVADLLRFIRNTSEHWHDKKPPTVVEQKVGTPKEYFLNLFPTLPVILHRVIRRYSDWVEREQLKEFF